MITEFNIPTHIQQVITAEQAHHYRLVPVDIQDGVICFLTHQPNQDLQQELEIVLGRPVKLATAPTEDIERYLSSNFRKKRTTSTRESLHYTADFLEKLLLSAKDMGSSDIHFEPYEYKCRVRFRLDGKLNEHYLINIEDYPVIVNKIKIKAGLDISEKRLPQDGRITIKTRIDEFDIRVSSLPTLYGEKLVLRLLSKDTTNIQLEDLGFTQNQLGQYHEVIRKPNGIILISGPTGSGKTTTLYATLKLLNKESTNILTIEDPIEYTLEGINQVQLKENIGLDFASTLRTFLRQDPDIIMVGEIRDVKTANMAIRAALTGHLVLSTIHTNSAWSTISRLIDMGIPSFLIANTLNVSIAQRLVRELCPHCKKKELIVPDLLPSHFQLPKEITHHYVAQGCHQCYHTGYAGRKAIYEVVPILDTLIPHIKTNQLEISDYLKTNTIATLRDRAVALIQNGTSSIDEVYALLAD